MPVLAQQKYSTNSKAAIRAFEDGTKYYDNRMMPEAVHAFENALAKDSDFIEAWTVLAEVYAMKGDYAQAKVRYRKAVSINPSFFPNNFFQLGRIELKTGSYEDAEKAFQNWKQYVKSPAPEMQQQAEKYLQTCAFAKEAIKHPVPFEPKNLGKGVNTADGEYYPSLTLNQKELVFTRDVADARAYGGHQEDFYVSIYKDSIWQTARNMGAPLNTSQNEGAPSISADGRVLFFTACDREDGKGSCDIYLSQRNADGSWTKPMNLGAPINTGAWESQPSFSSDGRSLYFVRGSYDRNRQMVQDIYMSTFQDDMTWSNPVRLSDTINTSGREESVFIHPDNQTLYFSSDGHPGMGGLDVFLSRRNADGSWGVPENMGYPINTWNDENSFLVSADAHTAYIASDREGGQGKLDMYAFDLYKERRPLLVSYVHAVVTDAATKQPLAAKFEIIDVETGNTVVANSTDKKRGEFLASLPAGRNYMLNVNKEGYLFYSDFFECRNAVDQQHAYELQIALHKPAPGEKVVLKNIFFDVNKFELKAESFPELKRLMAFLKSNPAVKIELSGHTDSTGDKKANQLLSENRAKAVYSYLIANGTDAQRLTYKGYGDSKPVAPNDTDEGRAQNRRTEFSIL